MMICWMREAVVKQGHMTEARAFARDIADYDNAHGGSFRVMHARFGQRNRLVWLGEFADLAALEAWQARAEADDAARALLARGLPLFVDGSITDSVFEAL